MFVTDLPYHPDRRGSMPSPEEVEPGSRPDRSDPCEKRPETGREEGVPLSLPVPGLPHDFQVKIASERAEWEEAFELVAANYRARGYLPADAQGLHFTPYHALPDTMTVVARRRGLVIATLSCVTDNCLLGVPLAKLFPEEIRSLRQSGRRLAEATCLADTDLGSREFMAVFRLLIRVSLQWHVRQGGDTAVIAVHPNHRNFYARMFGFAPLGPCRPYATVQGAPAEAFWLDWELMQANAPRAFEEMFREPLPAAALQPSPMPRSLIEEFDRRSHQRFGHLLPGIFDHVDRFGSPRLWKQSRRSLRHSRENIP
jgi:hypothetical protein